MAKFILRRIIILIPTLFIVSMVIFAITANLPGDRVGAFLGMDQRITPEERARVEALLGLDGSVVTQYGRWLGRVFQGDFGNSIQTRQPATEMLGSRIWNTFVLNGTSFVIAALLAIFVGIKQAVKKYKFTDNAWTVVSLLGISVPSFYLAYVLLFFVAIPFGLPFGGMRDTIRQVMGYANIFENFRDLARHMLLPVTVMVFMNLAVLTRYVRGTMIDVMNQDYIRTARSKGLKEKIVIYRHAFKNALIPLVTLLGLYIPSLFAGAVILEQIFLWPGIGRALIGAIGARDNSIVMLAMVFFASLTMLGNLLSDVLYSVADPRIRTK